jgi:signal transduction histidine kinase
MAASVGLALALSWTALGRQFDNYAYDFLFRALQPEPWEPTSVILAIDERTLAKYGGNNGIRAALAAGLQHLSAVPSPPAAVAVDVVLAEDSLPNMDERLEQAFATTPRLVLPAYILRDGTWENPIPRFARHAAAIGQVHASLDKFDSVSREAPLMKVGGRVRRWSLALEAFHARVGGPILESPEELVVGTVHIPSTLKDEFVDGRMLRIRYPPVRMGGIPRISVAELDANPALAAKFAGKAVFVGVTAQASGDSRITPYSNTEPVPGIEINASEYETIARSMFLIDADWSAVAAFCALLALLTGTVFVLTSGIRPDWIANTTGAVLLIASQAVPAVAFLRGTVWPWLPGTLSATFALAAAALWRQMVVRRALARAENERSRYQKAMQFVTHEMRTPLTAIQGSSELISRYGSMPEAKRKQMAEMINAESKRLARMIETFLSVERLSAGQMEMKQERFTLAEIVETCAARARAYAERKQIEIDVDPLPVAALSGDRELMEYAVYNLLTNAVKYSPAQTRVRVLGESIGDDEGGTVRLSIRDQGIGMDKKEVRRIFEKFYRTRTAEQSGEVGTGIGLSIVEQIVTQHGGTIQVESEPGKGSTFSLLLKKAR